MFPTVFCPCTVCSSRFGFLGLRLLGGVNRKNEAFDSVYYCAKPTLFWLAWVCFEKVPRGKRELLRPLHRSQSLQGWHFFCCGKTFLAL